MVVITSVFTAIFSIKIEFQFLSTTCGLDLRSRWTHRCSRSQFPRRTIHPTPPSSFSLEDQTRPLATLTENCVKIQTPGCRVAPPSYAVPCWLRLMQVQRFHEGGWVIREETLQEHTPWCQKWLTFFLANLVQHRCSLTKPEGGHPDEVTVWHQRLPTFFSEMPVILRSLQSWNSLRLLWNRVHSVLICWSVLSLSHLNQTVTGPKHCIFYRFK